MTIIANIDPADFEEATEKQLERARQEAQVAMGMAFYEVTMSNIGDTGADRPAVWPPLSPAYAKKVGRIHATLEVTGALRNAVKMVDSPEESTVSISNNDCPYALVHQFGGSKMPARPYFPVKLDGEPTEFSEAWVQAAAREAFREAVN